MLRPSPILFAVSLTAIVSLPGTSQAQQFLFFGAPPPPAYERTMRAAPPVDEFELEEDQPPSATAPGARAPSTGAVPAHLRRQIVSYPTREAPGTIVIDTANTYLYYVLGGGRAVRYGIGVGREGFTWSGVKTIGRKAEWPDWIPPAEMVARQPYLPRFMAGGPGNPLGARAMYLSNSLYRVHGTNDPSSIGKRVSSGCIRMLNEDVVDLYDRADIGTKVVVLPDSRRHRRDPDMVRTGPGQLHLSASPSPSRAN